MRAAAWYGADDIACPPQYLAGRDQIFRNSVRDREELTELKLKAKPKTHATRGSRRPSSRFRRRQAGSVINRLRASLESVRHCRGTDLAAKVVNFVVRLVSRRTDADKHHRCSALLARFSRALLCHACHGAILRNVGWG